MPAEKTGEGGEQLLFVEEVAEMKGVMPSTIRTYAADTNRAIRDGKLTDFHLPQPADSVLRTTVKSNGKPVACWTPVWRKSDIKRWLRYKRGPGGRPILIDGKPA